MSSRLLSNIFLIPLLCSVFFQSQSQAQKVKAESANAKLPIEYFTKPSDRRTAKISPDGKHIIAIITHQGKEVFGVIDIKKKEISSFIGVRGSGRNIGTVHWVNNERLVYSIYETKNYDKQANYTGELYAVNVDGSKHNIIFGYRAGEYSSNTRIRKRKSSYASHEILDYMEDDDKHILIAYYPWKVVGKTWRFDPMAKPLIRILNIYNGRLSNLGNLPLAGASAIVDNNGDVRFAIAVNKDNKTVISYRKTIESNWIEFELENFEGNSISPISFAENNNSVYLEANVGEGTSALYLLNLETSEVEKVFHNQNVDMSQIVRDFSLRRVVYVGTELGLPEYHYIEPNNKKSKLHKKLMKAFKAQDVLITSATKDGNKMIVLTYADNNPGDFYIFDTKTLDASYLMSRSSWVDPSLMVKSAPKSFTTRDGQTIFGYLTLPKNTNGKVPLVVHPHGGPHGVRDSWYYQGTTQLLANRGYAVLQVNYRGSGGFGKAYQQIGYGKWGTLMQDDLTDATRTLIDEGLVDADRICIYGGSYGGYAALMGVVRDPDLYQCAIGSVGVYDLPLMFEEGNIPNRLRNGLAYLRQAVGTDMNDLKQRSPVYNVEKIKAEILLIHGKKDTQVPIIQAYRLKEAFDNIGKKYGWLEIRNEGHGYRDADNRELVHKTILEFLDKNIGESSP
ncbi:MAG: S9 family peptidase [Kangiellaceae bacterium]|nr:S9 family peptidase [Kangiellaceae bacterium]